MVGLVGPTLWDVCSKLLFGSSGNIVTNPRDAELPTPSARSLQEEVLYRQADMGPSEPAQAGGVQCPSASSLLFTAEGRSRGRAGSLWCSLDSNAGYCKSNRCCFLSHFGSLSCGCWPHHSCSVDLDPLSSEQRRCWCAGTSPGGLKPLPVPPFLPPRCICATSVQPLALQACPRLDTLT